MAFIDDVVKDYSVRGNRVFGKVCRFLYDVADPDDRFKIKDEDRSQPYCFEPYNIHVDGVAFRVYDLRPWLEAFRTNPAV